MTNIGKILNHSVIAGLTRYIDMKPSKNKFTKNLCETPCSLSLCVERPIFLNTEAQRTQRFTCVLLASHYVQSTSVLCQAHVRKVQAEHRLQKKSTGYYLTPPKWIFFLFLLLTSFIAPEDEISKTPVFLDGEKLTYRIHYSGITGGEANITLQKTLLNDKEVFHAVLTGKTTGLVNTLYKVYDVYESYFDPVTNLPDKAIRNIREGNYRYYDEVNFNQKENYVVSQRNGKVSVPEKTLDMASVMFFVRRIDLNKLKENDIISLDTYFGDDLFPFYIVYRGKQTISIGSGKYRCFKFVPIVEPGRVFQKKDDMTIWFTDDENRLPVSIKFDIWVGSFKCDLVKFENLKYPLTAKVK